MYEPTSRYFPLETAQLEVTGPDGLPRLIAYTRRRFVPPTEGHTTLVEHRVKEGERLDLITARYLGEPTLFWQICDANNVMRPDELQETGRTVAIPLPRLG